MVTNFASKLMKKILSEKDLNAKGRREGKVRKGESGKVRWEKVERGENERVGRMHKYTEGKVKYFDNWKSGKRKRRCHKIYFSRHQEWRCGMATPVSHPFSARPEGWRSTSAVAGMPFRCGGTVPSV